MQLFERLIMNSTLYTKLNDECAAHLKTAKKLAADLHDRETAFTQLLELKQKHEDETVQHMTQLTEEASQYQQLYQDECRARVEAERKLEVLNKRFQELYGNVALYLLETEVSRLKIANTLNTV